MMPRSAGGWSSSQVLLSFGCRGQVPGLLGTLNPILRDKFPVLSPFWNIVLHSFHLKAKSFTFAVLGLQKFETCCFLCCRQAIFSIPVPSQQWESQLYLYTSQLYWSFLAGQTHSILKHPVVVLCLIHNINLAKHP